jgi:hypothetical protein
LVNRAVASQTAAFVIVDLWAEHFFVTNTLSPVHCHISTGSRLKTHKNTLLIC